MSFRDKDKVNCEIESGIIYGNGVTLENTKGKKKALYGITEGFAEYLNRLDNTVCKGHSIEYFFTDLLIFIYSEEILEYPFHNDPLGLIKDNRFYNLEHFTKELDTLFDCSKEIVLSHYFRKNIERIMQENKEMGRQIIESIGNCMELYNQSIIELYASIIREYLAYSHKHKGDRELFIKKLSSFLTNTDYEIAFAFDNEEHVLKKKLHTLIQSI